MLGAFSLTYKDRTIVCSLRSKLIWNVLAYLLFHRRRLVTGEELIANVWGSLKNVNPASALRTAIHRVRQILSDLTGNADSRFVISQNGGYIWDPEVPVELDVEQFAQALDGLGNQAERTDALLKVLLAYDGKFLSGFSGEMWVIPKQAFFQNQYEAAVDKLVPMLKQAERYEEGIALCRKAIRIEPWSEKICQYLMGFLLLKRDYEEVVSTYETISGLLLTTCGNLPDPTTRQLYQEALSFLNNSSTLPPDAVASRFCEQGEIESALVCDMEYFKILYQAQARSMVRSGMVVHTALLTLKPRKQQTVSAKVFANAMDNMEKHLAASLRKGDVITRCSSTQFFVMLLAANYENSEMICQRLIASFGRKHPHTPIYVEYLVQPIKPSTQS